MLGALGKGHRGEEVLVTFSPTWASTVLVSLSSTGAAELRAPFPWQALLSKSTLSTSPSEPA